MGVGVVLERKYAFPLGCVHIMFPVYAQRNGTGYFKYFSNLQSRG